MHPDSRMFGQKYKGRIYFLQCRRTSSGLSMHFGSVIVNLCIHTDHEEFVLLCWMFLAELMAKDQPSASGVFEALGRSCAAQLDLRNPSPVLHFSSEKSPIFGSRVGFLSRAEGYFTFMYVRRSGWTNCWWLSECWLFKDNTNHQVPLLTKMNYLSHSFTHVIITPFQCLFLFFLNFFFKKH